MTSQSTLTRAERDSLMEAIRDQLRDTALEVLDPRMATASGGIDTFVDRLDELVSIVSNTTAHRIESYLYLILADICAICPYQACNGVCPLRCSRRCALFEHARPIIEATYNWLHKTESADGNCPAIPTEKTKYAAATNDLGRTNGNSRKELRMFTRILIAVDSSAPAIRAIKTASDLAAQAGAVVRLVHVVHPPVPFSPSSIPTAMETETRMLAGARELLAGLHKEFPEGLTIEDAVLEGHPADQIVSEAATWQADLIVVGDRDKRSFSQFVLGTTADAVVRQAPCPVLVVRQKSVSGVPKTKIDQNVAQPVGAEFI